MKAMILAAGRGERMRPLTDSIPKPLLTVQGKPLIGYHLEKLARAGITEVVINLAHLAEQIMQALGDGSNYGLTIEYSPEQVGGLETGGGIYNALTLLGPQPFITINADIYTDYDFENLQLPAGMLGHLILAPNPQHNLKGDFSLQHNLIHIDHPPHRYTFTGIAIYHPQLFRQCTPGKFPLAPLLREYAAQQLISGEVYTGQWCDVGSLQRLEQLK